MKHRLTRALRCALGLALLLCTFASGQASAKCVQSDIGGRWQVSANVTEPPSVHWLECELEIAPDGYILVGACHGPDLKDTPVSSGEIEIVEPVACSFAGEFVLGGTLTRVTEAILSSDMATAKGSGNYDQGSFSFTMTRNP